MSLRKLNFWNFPEISFRRWKKSLILALLRTMPIYYFDVWWWPGWTPINGFAVSTPVELLLKPSTSYISRKMQTC